MKTSVFLFAAFAGLVLPAAAAPSQAAGTRADVGSRIEEATNALAMVQKAFKPFPGDLLRSEVLRNEDGSPMVEVGDDGSVKVKVRIAVDPALYREWTKGLMQKLDAVSTTYEDETVPCVLINSAASLAMSSMPGMGADLPPEYAAMVEYIRSKLNLTSLAFQRLDDLVASIGLPKDRLCTYCFDGKDVSFGERHCAKGCANCPCKCASQRAAEKDAQ